VRALEDQMSDSRESLIAYFAAIPEKERAAAAEKLMGGEMREINEALTAAATEPGAPRHVSVPALADVTPPANQSPDVKGTGTGDGSLVRMRDREPVTMDGVATEAAETLDYWQGGNTRGDHERMVIGRLDQSDAYPEDRTFSGPDEVDGRKLDAVVASAWRPEKWSSEEGQALVASGGFCAAPTPDYSQLQVAGSHRPLVDGLPTFDAPRGQVVVSNPVRLVDIQSSTGTTAGSAISVWSNATDVAGNVTKPSQTLACPTQQTIQTGAIVESVKIGNFQARANPELVREFLDTVHAAWARRAESELLRQIDGFSTPVTSATQILGATNEFIGYLRQAAAAQRSRQRIPHDGRLRLLVPVWVIDYLAADQAHTHAGDGLDRFGIDEQRVRSWLNAANLNVTFYEDTAATGATTNQLFVPQAAGDLENFPPTPGVTSSRVIAYLFPEGTFARAYGGTLDLGIVRDSTLNATNDFAVFSESWEAIVPKVHESLKLTMTLCTTGAGALDVTSVAYCTAS
jgi:hypothetical protein